MTSHTRRQSLTIVLVLGVLAIGSRAASAAPCVPGTLSDYLALGGGCTIGSAQFDSFALVELPNGATAISTDAISVAPFGSASSIGFVFGLDVTADAGELFELLFGYQVSGVSLRAASLAMAGASASGDAAITTVEDLCVGAAFDFSISCPAQHETNIVFAIGGDQLLTMNTGFAPIALLGVVNDIAVDGGIAGTGALSGSVTNQFALAATTAVPEPSTLLLLVAGLAPLVPYRQRRH